MSTHSDIMRCVTEIQRKLNRSEEVAGNVLPLVKRQIWESQRQTVTEINRPLSHFHLRMHSVRHLKRTNDAL